MAKSPFDNPYAPSSSGKPVYADARTVTPSTLGKSGASYGQQAGTMSSLQAQGLRDYQSFYEQYIKMLEDQRRPRTGKMYFLGGY